MAKKNNTAEKTILDAEKITKALKEGTEKKLRSLMNEAISNIIKEDDETDDEEPVSDDSYEVEDVDAEETPKQDDDVTPTDDESDEEGEETTDAEEPAEGGDADDEWSEMEDYKVGDNDYDFTGVDGETALKVYNKLGDDDEIFVTKDEDGNYEMKDEDTGAEYVIELNPEDEDADADAENDEDPEIELDLGDDEDGFDGDEEEPEFPEDSQEDEGDDIEIELGDDESTEDPEDLEDDQDIEIDLGDEDEDEDENKLDEDLGYTDSYQKDVFKNKPNMSEPAKGMNDWDEGAPKGAEKPWAGKGNMKPFGKKKEVDEQVVLGSEANNRKQVKSAAKRQEKTGFKKVSKNGEYKGDINESKVRKIVEAAKAIQKQNKLYEGQINKIKQSLYEAAVLNVNLGKVVQLLVTETTTKAEKQTILDRFNNVKTIKEGKMLFETIQKELNGNTQKTAIVERQISMAPSLNETTMYTSNPSLDMMARMDNLANYYKK